jgi:hypothetical protein
MTFAEADAQYEVVKQQYLAGALDDDQFEEQLHRLMVLDEAGLWWAKSRENGSWHFYDSGTGDWVAAAPPAGAPVVPPPPSLPSTPAADPLPKRSKAPEVPANQARPAATGAGESNLPKWAAVKPGSAAVPGAPSLLSASAALPSTSQGAPATASSSARDFGPMAELTGGMRVLFYILALLLPLLGIILYFVYRNKPAQSDRTAARAFLILGIASIVFSCMCSTTFFLLEATMLGTGT